ncbi:hypothetical protein [Cynomolgus macaque cytomegalovirus strain Mauritius]|uniref:Uncharacterized protein n=1 Tax=Cynomolgus macaque cytomegalovirus strain Mauritius TaxID=1690255 RepID=A0A0K1H0H8_9BETA|nr:hypothetical protein [Cynomolgus macaque cytomegalovirus strain Mauritius]AXG21875.1 hypothetical protein [synthetic construct]AXG22143.1 hypothetical protein [synthetic construct]
MAIGQYGHMPIWIIAYILAIINTGPLPYWPMAILAYGHSIEPGY